MKNKNNESGNWKNGKIRNNEKTDIKNITKNKK